jgi:type IV pilus assembly protein PilY1
MRKQTIIGTSIIVASVMGVFVGALSLLPARAAVCEFPLFIQQGSVDANVMFLFDNSGSMNEAIAHDAYDPNRRYTGTLDPDRTYYVASDGTYSRRSFKTGAPTTPTAYLVDSDGTQDGRYFGNYLNWIFQYATSAQRSAIPRFTRIQMAKAAVNDIITNMSTNVRYGVWNFNDDRPSTSALAPMGTDPATIISRVNAMEGDSWTPLGETMAAIADYYRTDPSAVQYDCQRNFTVVVTDGYPTKDHNTKSPYFDPSEGLGSCTSIGAPNPDSDDCSEYMDDVAHWMRNNDIRTDLDGEQYMNTYTVGMNVDAPILQWTADDGDGAYFVANNAAQLSASLQNVLRDILNRISSGSAVAVVSTEGQGDDFLYRGKFLPTTWVGSLEAFVLPYTTGDAPIWEAGQILSQRSPSTRTIFTSVNGVKQDFTASNVGNLATAMGLTTTLATNVINWTRGENVAGLRDRQGWILADIVESAPVTVGRVMGAYTFNDFRSFRNANQSRERAIYVGSNGGMVHSFLADTGEELWAYIPNTVLPSLDDIANTNYCHAFTVNGTPRVVDAYLNGRWRTVLIQGQKQGGSGYVCLDVTDPRNPEFMWENNLANVSESWAQVEVTRVKFLDKWVGIVGSGLDPTTGEAHFIAFDMEDGTQLHEELLSTLPGELNMATAGKAVDLDFDGWHDVVYMGDLAGNLWRIGLKGDDWERTLLFKAEDKQAIQAQPIITVDFDRQVFVYFGTGRYLDNDDFTTTDKQTFYCIKDDHGGDTVSRAMLVDQTDVINPVEGFRGWFIDLEVKDGERITEPDALVAGIIYFTSFAPNPELCAAGGTSYLYRVKFRNGAGFDDDDDDSNDTTDGRVVELGDGIATKPVIDLINQHVLIQGSDTRIHVEDTQGQIRLLTVRSWRQQY